MTDKERDIENPFTTWQSVTGDVNSFTILFPEYLSQKSRKEILDILQKTYHKLLRNKYVND